MGKQSGLMQRHEQEKDDLLEKGQGIVIQYMIDTLQITMRKRGWGYDHLRLFWNVYPLGIRERRLRAMAELKPCPFCGGEATLCSVVSMQHEIAYVVKCDDLNCVMSAGGTLRQTISQAEEAWNRRAGDGK